MNKHLSTLLTLFLLFLLAATSLVACNTQEEQQPSRVSSDITHFSNLSITTNAWVGSVMQTSDLVATDDIAVSDDATIYGFLNLDDTNLTVTTATITPTVTMYHADSAGAVTWTLPACSVNGQLLIIYGDDANTITIADSNIRSTDGNAITVGQYDVVVLICVDTEWNHVAKSANS
jgi:hypothetical protein